MASVLSTRLPAPSRAALAELAVIASEQYHCSQALAEVMAAGGLGRSDAARRVARRWGLTTIDTADARERKLLQ